ncbi:hypothetical protein D3C80_2156670 [compost metagenome]
MLGDQAVLAVVFEFQRVVVAVVDAEQPSEVVIAVTDLNAVRQGLELQAPGAVAFIAGDELRTVIAKLGFIQ